MMTSLRLHHEPLILGSPFSACRRFRGAAGLGPASCWDTGRLIRRGLPKDLGGCANASMNVRLVARSDTTGVGRRDAPELDSLIFQKLDLPSYRFAA